jgi:hypothetical protein
VLPTPVETAADDAFHDPMVGGGGETDAYAKVDLPDERDVEIDSGKNGCYCLWRLAMFVIPP